MRRACLVLLPCLLGACPATVGDGEYEGRGSARRPPAKIADPAPRPVAPPEAKAPEAKAPEAKAPPPDVTLGKILASAPLPIGDMLGAAPPDVEKHLGPHQGKGGTRKSCVRFIPERTWFKCSNAWQRYTDKTGNFKKIQVVYEDGVATQLHFENPTKGEGPFDPRGALALAGLELPGEPTVDQPSASAKVWDWFNNQARFRHNEREYRVRVSTLDDSWEKAKIELMLNDHLNDDERSRLLRVDKGVTKANPEGDAAAAPPDDKAG